MDETMDETMDEQERKLPEAVSHAAGGADGPLSAEEEPALFHAADQASVAAQRRYVLFIRLGLLMALLAAVAGAVNWGHGAIVWAGVLSAAAFMVAIITELLSRVTRPDRIWYEGRAVAESVKTLAWKFAVGGAPFPLSSPLDECEELFLGRLEDLLRDIDRGGLPLTASRGLQITPGMRRLRDTTLRERISVYQRERLGEQQEWYTAKYAFNRRRASQWSYLLLAVEILGVVAGLLLAAGALAFDAIGIASTLVAALGAWSQVRQYDTLAHAYSIAGQELATVLNRSQRRMDEDTWSAFVRDAEEVISREHKLWASRRGVLSLRP
jgi:hypothetical protein